MQQGAAAYGRTAQATQSPRDLESGLLMKAAVKLQKARDNWNEADKQPLEEALFYNRKLWTVLISAVDREDNPLPVEIKRNIITLGLFVLNRTLDLQFEPKPAKLGVMISINRDLAAGLRGSGVPDPLESTA